MLADVEDAIVDRIKDYLGEHLRAVETLPGPWDEQALALAMRQTPGVYVYWDGGQAGRSNRARLAGRYRVYAVTGHASGERQRRRGAGHQIGAYEIIERVVPLLDGYRPAELGSLEFQDIAVLSPVSSQRKGITVYEVGFALEMGFPPLKDVGDLADFESYTAEHQVGDGPSVFAQVDMDQTEE